MRRSRTISFNPFQNASSRLTLVFVTSDLDRALDDRRFHEDTPNCPSFDGIAFSGMTRLRSGPHSTPSDPIFESDTCDHVPPNARPANIRFLIVPAALRFLFFRSQIVN